MEQVFGNGRVELNNVEFYESRFAFVFDGIEPLYDT